MKWYVRLRVSLFLCVLVPSISLAEAKGGGSAEPPLTQKAQTDIREVLPAFTPTCRVNNANIVVGAWQTPTIVYELGLDPPVPREKLLGEGLITKLQLGPITGNPAGGLIIQQTHQPITDTTVSVPLRFERASFVAGTEYTYTIPGSAVGSRTAACPTVTVKVREPRPPVCGVWNQNPLPGSCAGYSWGGTYYWATGDIAVGTIYYGDGRAEPAYEGQAWGGRYAWYQWNYPAHVVLQGLDPAQTYTCYASWVQTYCPGSWVSWRRGRDIFIYSGSPPPNCHYTLCPRGRNCSNRGCSPGCFAPGTKIRMGDGALKLAEKIEEGESIWNPKLKVPVKVRRIIRGPEREPLYVVHLAKTKVKVSGKHPMITRRGLVAAEKLQKGDFVLGEDTKYHLVVDLSRFSLSNDEFVYNFELDVTSLEHDNHLIIGNGVATGDYQLQYLIERGHMP